MHNFRSFTAAIGILIGFCAIARADGGQVRVMQTHGDVKLTIFTAPSPLRAGPIDVSVLLQDAHTGQTIPSADVTIELTPPNNSQPPIRASATTEAATNKLLRAALIELPSPGEWQFRVECKMPRADSLVTATFTATAAEPLPRWLTVWPWFTWPIAAVTLFAVHRALVTRHTSSP